MARYIDTTKLMNNMVTYVSPKLAQRIIKAVDMTPTEDVVERNSVLEMLSKINNAVEDGDGFQYEEWVEYVKDIPSAEKTTLSAEKNNYKTTITDTDLISRQAVIEYINNWFEKEKYYHPYAKGKTIPTDELMDLIKQVPSAEKIYGDLISRKAVINAMYELCDTGETLKENPWRDNPHIDAIIETIEEMPSAEKTDSFIPQEDVADILNTVEFALKGTNYEVVGYDNTDGFLKVLIDVK